MFKTNNNIGITINPEKETALVIAVISLNIIESFGKNAWKNTKKKSDVKIIIDIFEIKSWKVWFLKLNVFKNSVGINKINKATKKRIKNQKIASPDQVVMLFSTNPADSISKYKENPRSNEPSVKK